MKRGPFTPEEDAQILAAHAVHGNKWAVISRSMPGRTDNQVKNRFNSTLRRTLAQNGKAPPASSPPKKASSPVAAAQHLSSPMGSRKQSSNQLAKQANLKRVASQILETMSCDESMESSQDNKDKRNNNNNNNMNNNTGKETTSKNAMKRPRKSPTKTKLGKSVRGPSRGPSQDREDSGGSESVGLETLIQASLMELQRIKSGKSASGFEKEYYTMNNDQTSAHGGFGTSTNNNNNNNNNNNKNINNNNPTQNNATMSNMSDRTMNDSRGMVSSMSMENLNRAARGGFSMPGIPNDSYDWRANSPVIGLPAFHSLNNQLVRRPSMLNIASQSVMVNNANPGGGGEQQQNANEMNDPRAGTSALSTPVTITPNLASSWYGRMLENLGWRNHFPLDVLPMQEQEDIHQKDAKEAHEKFQPIENGEDEECAPKEAATAATTKITAATDAALIVKTEEDNVKTQDELPSPLSDNTMKNDMNGTTGTAVNEAVAC